jgi:arylsulfatase A-like enzyme
VRITSAGALCTALLVTCTASEAPQGIVVRLGDPGLLASRPAPSEPVRLSERIRQATAVEPGSPLEVVLEGPADALVFSIGMEAAPSCLVPVAFSIDTRAEEGWAPLFSETLPAGSRSWFDHALPIPENVRALRLAAEPRWSDEISANRCGNEVRALFGSILMRTHDTAPPRPNVIVISLDTLGATYLSSFGNAPGTSPHIDAFLAESFSFRRAYAQYGHTLPSHASLFSGLHPASHGIYPRGAIPAFESLVGQLADAGYFTAGFTEGGFVGSVFGFSKDFDWYDDGLRRGDSEFTAETTFTRAAEWLERFGREGRTFLFVHTFEVHLPYTPRAPEALAAAARISPGDARIFSRRRQSRLTLAHNDGSRTLPAADLYRLQALHSGEIHFLDTLVDRFLAQVEALGLAEDTLVVLLADHGDAFGADGKLGHGDSLHDAIHHVPLGFRWPAGIAPGSSDTPVQLVDVLPTVLDLAGLPTPSGVDGRSLAKLVLGRGTIPEQPAFSELRTARGECIQLRLRPGCRVDRNAVRTRRFKLVRSTLPAFERLYDLDADPDERIDVKEAYPDELARHAALLDAHLAAARQSGGRELITPELDATTRSQLEELGYLE